MIRLTLEFDHEIPRTLIHLFMKTIILLHFFFSYLELIEFICVQLYKLSHWFFCSLVKNFIYTCSTD